MAGTNDRMFELPSEAVPPGNSASWTEASHLTADDLRRAIEMVRNDTRIYRCVGSDTHVVHPKEMERGGLARCANCFQVIDLGPKR